MAGRADEGGSGQVALVDAATLAAWSARFASEVDHRLEVPAADRQRYLGLLARSLSDARIDDASPQAFVLVDRSPQVQAAFVVVRTSAAGWAWIGATAVSTGKTGTYQHFVTPTGVFAHTPANPDFRAEGTFNENHIRGYGLRGRRVFDFGWQQAERGWGGGLSAPGTTSAAPRGAGAGAGRAFSTMRLQMHATDPNVLEARLGRVASEGCIRIPAKLNVFLDGHGILDAAYEQELAAGHALWVLRPNRQPVPWPGRYLVIVDSQATERPNWSPVPGVPSTAAAAQRASGAASASVV